MSSKRFCARVLLAAAAVAAAVAVAPVAAAAPQCTNTGPNTTQCETNGSAQIVTSPPANNNYGYWGYPIIGFGGWGFGI
jgi:hypothetical protein